MNEESKSFDERGHGPSFPGDQQITFIAPTQAEEAAIIRKLDKRLMPFVLVLYSFAILDRSNLGNAKLARLDTDTDTTGLRYNWLGTIFYIAYILFQWQTICWKQFSPSRWAAFVIFFWGFISSVQAAATSWAGLMVLRFLLGIAEAGFATGVPLYLSFFYPRGKIGFRQGIFVSGAALANAYGGALAYGITQIKGSIAPWRILFLIEGLPTIVLAGVVLFFLPNSTSTATFFNEREKIVAAHIVSRNQTMDDSRKTGLRLRELLAGFENPKSYVPALMYFGINVSYASLPLFIPTIIKDIGKFSSLQSQGLSSPPYIYAFIVILSFTFLSDRTRVCGPYIVGASIVAAVGFIMLATTTGAAARYTGVYLATTIFVCVPLLLTWVSTIHSTESARAGGLTVLATIGQCGPVLGTNVFPPNEAPYYRKGMWISTAFCLLTAALAVMLSLWLAAENRQMEKAGLLDYGSNENELRGESNAEEECERRYRYML